ncbi:hypothetical protein K470DRAFT_265247 [Piedraia hortae CBS 480.64]|uniref:Uncharacterized protein n=1 Tax=Piedraia hortae CBS 480.64 TaxID=1314780 RepID=A0A6A7BWD9_9PEZI|nr:hypothetical protein K470DRAFT_265247 [Piedraia hortae CBS 480.64]
MSTLLTRRIFRQLLSNKTLVFRGCLRSHRLPVGKITESRRTLLDLATVLQTSRKPQGPETPLGLSELLELEKRKRMRARLPSPESVKHALTQFIHAKCSRARAIGQVVMDNEARLLLDGLHYVLESSEDQRTPIQFFRPFAKAGIQLFPSANSLTEAHMELFALIYEQRPYEISESESQSISVTYCALLCRLGKRKEAQELVLELEQQPQISGDSGTSSPREAKWFMPHWRIIIEAAASSGSAAEIHRIYDLMHQRGLDRSGGVKCTMLKAAIRHGDMDGMHKWWQEWKYWSAMQSPSSHPRHSARQRNFALTVQQLLKLCVERKNLVFGQEIVREVAQGNPDKLIWDGIIQFAAASGKDVDDISRLLKSMPGDTAPDSATINGLVEVAVANGDHLLAERFTALAQDHGISPDVKSCILQIDNRTHMDDLDGALEAYKNMQACDYDGHEDVPAINRLIVALCNGQRHSFETVMELAAGLSTRKAQFEPATVSTLAILHLCREEAQDFADLLYTHAFSLTSAGRTSVCKSLVDHAVDDSTDTETAWLIYTVLEDVFHELPRDQRTRLLAHFFSRSSPSKAVRVLSDMRAHSRLDVIPTPDTYTTALLCAGKHGEIDDLEVVHNQLRLDFRIDMTTQVRNALMLAYTACRCPNEALTYWDDIENSVEGPTYNSLHIVFRACEYAEKGNAKARELWCKLVDMGVDLDPSLWASYAAAIVSDGDVTAVTRELDQAHEKGEVEIDSFILASLFMGAPNPLKQKEVEAWARGYYPRAWAKLVVEEGEFNERVVVNVDRSMSP